MEELRPNIVFHGCHFIRHHGICYRICVKLLQLMYAVITYNLVKKRSLYILQMTELQPIIVFHSRHFVRLLGICYRTCVKLLQLISGIIAHNSVEKNEVSVLINGRITAKYSVSRPPFCLPSWNLLSHLCKTLTGFVRCHSEQSKRKTASLSPTVFLRSTNTAHTQTDTHTDRQTQIHIRRWHKAKCNTLHFA